MFGGHGECSGDERLKIEASESGSVSQWCGCRASWPLAITVAVVRRTSLPAVHDVSQKPEMSVWPARGASGGEEMQLDIMER